MVWQQACFIICWTRACAEHSVLGQRERAEHASNFSCAAAERVAASRCVVCKAEANGLSQVSTKDLQRVAMLYISMEFMFVTSQNVSYLLFITLQNLRVYLQMT